MQTHAHARRSLPHAPIASSITLCCKPSQTSPQFIGVQIIRLVEALCIFLNRILYWMGFRSELVKWMRVSPAWAMRLFLVLSVLVPLSCWKLKISTHQRSRTWLAAIADSKAHHGNRCRIFWPLGSMNMISISPITISCSVSVTDVLKMINLKFLCFTRYCSYTFKAWWSKH